MAFTLIFIAAGEAELLIAISNKNDSTLCHDQANPSLRLFDKCLTVLPVLSYAKKIVFHFKTNVLLVIFL